MKNNLIAWSESLKVLGFQEFSKTHQKILKDMDSKNIHINNAAFSEATSEALLQAVAVMIEENNKALLSETAK